MEQRASLDLLWPLVDLLAGGRLDYAQPLATILANLLAPGGTSVRVDYPFSLADGRDVTLPLWLFSVVELERLFRGAGLRVVARIGVHQVTNLLPSTLLHRAPPPAAVRTVFSLLRRADAACAAAWPTARLGCAVVYALRKTY